jgi:hypothetical protein
LQVLSAEGKPVVAGPAEVGADEEAEGAEALEQCLEQTAIFFLGQRLLGQGQEEVAEEGEGGQQGFTADSDEPLLEHFGQPWGRQHIEGKGEVVFDEHWVVEVGR